MSSVRFTFLVIVTITLLWLGYPAAFVATHGFNAQGWPDLEHTAYTWFQFPSYNTLDFIQLALVQVFTTYKRMALGQSPAFPDGGLVALICIISLIFSSGAFISAGMKLQTLRHRTSRFGDARFAASHVVTRMRTGVELGLDPKTKIPVRIQLEGNILTIAPPRRGKTSGLILPNLAYSDYKAFGGPVVVIDPKGDAYRAAHRRRTAMGRRVRCIDPLGIVGGTDRWNPLQTLEPNDVLYLQAMVQALLPAADATTEGGAFFRDRASVLLSAAMQVAIRDNHTDVAAAAGLINKPLQLLTSLQDRDDALSQDARAILNGDERARSNILSTAGQAMSWLLDHRMQEATERHTFELKDLCEGETDLFIVLPADERKVIIAPYIRWLLSDLFSAVRKQSVRERIIIYIDEANILGKFSSILSGSGELPGYGISLWTFWQSESQLIETYGSHGAAILKDTAEVIQIFNLSRANADECKRWSEALGTYTGIDETETKETASSRPSVTRAATLVPLVHPAEMAAETQHHSIVFLNIPAYTTDPLKLLKTRADRDKRFMDLLEPVVPVGVTGTRQS
jgi:type IV secretion system protein VirD4